MTWWYVNRAAGLVAWVLLSTSIVFGLLLSSKALGKRVRPNWIQDLHRGLSGLAVVFVGIHVAGAIGDNYIHFGAADVLVPFASGWRPVAIAWGVVSAYLLLAVELSSLLRKHLSAATWRKVHFLSFPLFITATTHGITTGTEAGTTAGIAVAALVTAAIAGLTTLRVFTELAKPDQPPRRAGDHLGRAHGTPATTGVPTSTLSTDRSRPDQSVELAPPRWEPAAPPRRTADAATSRSGSSF